MKKTCLWVLVICLSMLIAACGSNGNSGNTDSIGGAAAGKAADTESENVLEKTYTTALDESNSSELHYGGFKMRIPKEFGAPASNSDEHTQYFYLPGMGKNQVVMLMVQNIEAKATQKEFENERAELVSGFIQRIDESVLKERKSIIVAGLPAEHFLATGKTEGLPCTFDVIFIFSEKNQNLVSIGIGAVGKEISEYRRIVEDVAGSVEIDPNNDYYFKAADSKADASLEENIDALLNGSDTVEQGTAAAGTEAAGTDTSNPGTVTETPETEPAAASSGVSPEFKAALDSYERFFDEYIAIMNRMKDNPSDLSVLSQYADYMGRYADMLQKFEAMEKQDMTKEELAYYLEVSNRISQKLLNAM